MEEEAKIEVARAQAEVADMRREHSKNMKFMNKTQLQEKDWERQGEMLKTSVRTDQLSAGCSCANCWSIVGEI